MPDELDGLLDQMAADSQQSSDLKGRFRESADIDPEAYAQHMRTAALSGVAPSIVAKDPKPFESEARAAAYDPDLVQEVTPALAAWLVAHEDNVPVSRDDIPTLQRVEESAKSRALKAEEERVAEDNRRRGSGVYSGLGATALGGIGTLASTIKDAQSATIRATIGRMFGKGAVETLETVGKVNPLQWAINGLDLGGKRLTAWAKPYEYETENLVVKDPVTGKEFLNFSAATPFNAQGFNPKGGLNVAKIIAGELAPTAATIGLATVTGGAGAAGAAPKAGRLLALAQRIGQYAVSAPGLLEVGRTVQGQYQNGVQFLMSKDPALSQEDAEIKAAPGALLAGLLSGPTGAAMEGKILNDLMTKVAKAPGAQSLIKKWGSKLLSLGITGAKEGAQEVVQGFAEDLADWVTINPDKTVVQVAGNAIQNLTGGVAMGGGMHLMIPGGHGPDKPVGNIQDLVDAAKESKLLKRSPEKFREAAGSMLQGETTLVEPGAFIEYFQSQGLDPYAMADKVGVKNLDEAMASGNPLIMETADYLTQLAVDHHEGLAPDLRTSIGEWTPRMAEENVAALDTAREEMVQAQQGIEAAKTLTLKEQIREDLVRKFDPLFEPSTAGTYADAFANILATLEIRSGQDLSKWREGLTVSRPMEGERGKPVSDVIEGRLAAAGGENGTGTMFQTATPEEMQARRQKESDLSLAYNPQGSRPVLPAPAPTEALFHGSSSQDLAPGDLSIAHANPNSYFGSGVYMGSKDVAEGHVIRGNKGSLHEVRPKLEAPIDLGTDKIYTVEELKSIGIESTEEMSGFRAWRELIRQHGGNNGARDYLMSRGYDGVRFTNGSDPNPAYVAWTQDAIGENIPLSSFTKNRNMETGGQDAIPSEPGTGTGTGEGGGLRSSDWQPIDLASTRTPGREASGVGQTLFQDDRQRRARQAMARSLSPSGQGTELNMRADEARMSEASFRAWEEEIKAIQLGTVHEGKRGFIQFGDGYQTHVGLLESANLSTLIHEIGGHFAFEIMGDLALRPDTPRQIKDDYAKLLDAVGAIDGVVGSEQHENFARLTEAYFMEGKAPSEELRGTFARVKEWMKLIYRQIKNLGVKLSPEVRAVFDRMYATDEAIAQARENSQETRKLISKPEDVGWDQATYDLYGKLIARGQEKAAVTVEQKLIAEAQRQHEDWYKAERESVRADVESGVDSRKDFKDLKALQRGQLEDGTPIKLDRAQIVALIGEKETQAISRSKGAVYAKEGGVDIDTAAEIMGYESGRQLVETLAGIPKRAELIERLTDEIMKAKHGDMATDGTLADEAMLAVHQQVDAERMMMELQAFKAQAKAVDPLLKKQQRDTKGKEKSAMADIPPIATFRAAALEIVNSQKIMDLNPERYRTTGLRESKKAFEAMGKQDFEAGAIAKKNELMNHFLYLEAVKAKALAEKQAGKARDLAKPAAQKRVGKAQGDYLNQLNSILDQFEFAKIPLKDILARQHGREEWVNGQMAANGGDGTGIIMPDSILFDEIPKNYKELTPPELSAVMDMLNNIQAVARNQYKVIAGEEEEDFDTAIEEMVGQAYGTLKRKLLPLDPETKTLTDKVVSVAKSLNAGLATMENLVDHMDGHDINGPWRRYIFEPMCQAQFLEYELNQRITNKLAEAMEKMPEEQRKALTNIVDVDGVGPVSMKFILSVALNSGNDSNQTKMLEGMGWADRPEVVGKMLDYLTRSDWEFVQGTWDALESLWPDIAALEKRVTGIEPVKVERSPSVVTFKDGSTMKMQGGYYPVSYDRRKSSQGEMQADVDIMNHEGGFKGPITFKGHTKERVSFAAPLNMDFEDVLVRHVSQVVKDLSHREAAMSVAKIIKNQKVRTALSETMGQEYTDMLMPWLKGTVNDAGGQISPDLTIWKRMLLGLRSNMVVAGLGFRAGSVIVQATDIARVWASRDMSTKHLGKALMTFSAHPIKTTRLVRSLSKEMVARSENLDRDTRAMYRRNMGKDGAYIKAQKAGMWALAAADTITSVTTWLATFQQAEAQGKPREQAIREADSIVRTKLMSAAPKDQAAIQRAGDIGTKFLTMYLGDAKATYGMMNEGIRDIFAGRNKASSAFMLMMVGMLIPILGQLIKNRGPKDDEDKYWWLAKNAALSLPNSIPILRDISQALESGRDYKFSPMATTIDKSVKAARVPGKLIEGEEEWDDAFLTMFDATGTLLGLPGTSQAVTTTKYLKKVSTGEEQPDNAYEFFRDAILGPNPKSNK